MQSWMSKVIARLRGVDKVNNDPLQQVLLIEGSVSREEAARLMELAQSVPKGQSIVEIGSHRGRSSVALAMGSKRGGSNSRVFAIDPHIEFTGVKGRIFGPADQAAFYANIVRCGVGEIVCVVSIGSQAAARGWSGSDIGLLFIDGDHTYEAVRGDFHSWYPFVTQGGIVAFHDALDTDVKRFIEEAKREFALEPLWTVNQLACLRKSRAYA